MHDWDNKAKVDLSSVAGNNAQADTLQPKTCEPIDNAQLNASFCNSKDVSEVETNRANVENTEISKQKTTNRKLVKTFIIDTIASVSFAFPIGASIDLIFTGLSPSQMLSNRGFIAITNILTGGIYGKYRDLFYKRFGGENPSQLKKFYLDVGTNFTFSVPIYILTSKISGASWLGISKGMIGVAVSCLFLSRAYGVYLDFLRRSVGLKGASEQNSDLEEGLEANN